MLADRGYRFGNLLLGLGLTGKQFGLPLLAPVWKASRGERIPLVVGIALAIVLVIVPFFVWSPRSFLDGVLYLHLAMAPDLNSLTLRSAVFHLLGISIPGSIAAVSTMVLIGWITWRAPATKAAAGLWMATTLLVFCLLFAKGYFNYFYLCSYLFLLGTAALDPGSPPAVVRN